MIEHHKIKVAQLEERVIHLKIRTGNLEGNNKNIGNSIDIKTSSGRKKAFDMLHRPKRDNAENHSDMKGGRGDLGSERSQIWQTHSGTGNTSTLIYMDEQSKASNKNTVEDLPQPMSFNAQFANVIRR